MAKTEEGVQERVELEYPTELLKKMVDQRSFPATEDELSLGLSSNGRFGVDPKDPKLVRSSSTPAFNGGGREREAVVAGSFAPASSLGRASSLPAEEWRKRKAQGGDNGGSRRSPATLNGFCGIGMWRLERTSGAGEEFDWKWSRSEEPPRLPNPPKAPAGNSIQREAQSQASIIHPPPGFHRQQAAPPEREVEIAGVGRVSRSIEKELMRKVFSGMPRVSTMGDGPNGEKVEGFLFEYRTVEELSIVCRCHGRFFSPAEFVKHAGGGDVACPTKHIIVSPALS